VGESWVVRNNSGKSLFLTNNGILFRKNGDIVDLVVRTGRRVHDLEFDKEIIINLSHNNLVTVSKDYGKEDTAIVDNSKIEEKLNLLIDAVSNIKNIQNLPSENNGLDEIKSYLKSIASTDSFVEKKEEIVNEEEKIREDVLDKLINNNTKFEGQLDNFGKNKRELESEEDFTDLIDF